MSEVSDTAALVEQSILDALEPRIIKAENGREFLLVPPNTKNSNSIWRYDDITPENFVAPLAPKLVEQHVMLQDVESLIAYVNRFKNTQSLLFADIQANHVLAIIDYHGAPAQDATDRKVEGNHTEHRASLVLPFSLEWQIWNKIDGVLMSHVDFANFLEENAPDVQPLGEMKDMGGNMVEDAPTTLFELVRELQVKSGFSASSAIRNGDFVEVEMMKNDDVSTKRNVALPLSISLAIPVYFGEAKIVMQALMRRRVVDGALKLGLKLVRPEQHRQDEFKRIVNAIEQEVALATHYGTPS